MNKKLGKLFVERDIFTDIGAVIYCPKHPATIKDCDKFHGIIGEILTQPRDTTMTIMELLEFIDVVHPNWLKDIHGYTSVCASSGLMLDAIQQFHRALINPSMEIVVAEQVYEYDRHGPELYIYDSTKYNIKVFNYTVERFDILGKFEKC